jgi:hypothetical protein
MRCHVFLARLVGLYFIDFRLFDGLESQAATGEMLTVNKESRVFTLLNSIFDIVATSLVNI